MIKVGILILKASEKPENSYNRFKKLNENILSRIKKHHICLSSYGV
jgi:hypothetical protein